MDQDRRAAAAWAEDWKIRKKNKRVLTAVAALFIIALIAVAASYAALIMSRTTFGSAAEMREAMQGRFSIESSYMDIIIEGSDVTLTYWSYSHYNRRYAEEYGYDAEEDSVYTDRVVKWDYRHGVMKTEWMGDMIVDSDGNIRRGRYTTFYRTDKPRPDPIDPSTLGSDQVTLDGNGLAEDYENDEDEEALEEREKSLEEVEEAADEALAKGLLPYGNKDE